MSKNNEPLICVLDRFEDGQAVLLFEFSQHNKKELVVPKRYLPKKVKEGAVLHLEFYDDEDSTKRRENLARNILEEILGGE